MASTIESKNKYDFEVTDEHSKFMRGIINKVIDEAGCRIPCSENEKKGAEIIAGELEKYCDEVDTETFTLSPNAFLGWIRLTIVLMFFSFLFYYLGGIVTSIILAIVFYALSTVIVISGITILWQEFFNYNEFIDRWFKKKQSQNVIGKIRGKGEVKRIIIYSGHVDSAIRFNLLQYFKYFYPIISLLGIFGFFAWTGASIINLILSIFGHFGVIDKFFKVFLYVIIPIMALLFFFLPVTKKQQNTVPGAVDNLSAVSIIIAVAKYLKNNRDLIPANTEIRLIAFGCEEAGLRGAYRYVEAHYDELSSKDTYVLNMDGIQDPEHLKIMDFEPTTRTQHSEEMSKIIKQAADECNVKVSVMGSDPMDKLVSVISGGTDATAFSKAKIRATSIVGMDMIAAAKYYHQTTDTVDKILPGALENTFKLLVKTIEVIGRKKID